MTRLDQLNDRDVIRLFCTGKRPSRLRLFLRRVWGDPKR